MYHISENRMNKKVACSETWAKNPLLMLCPVFVQAVCDASLVSVAYIPPPSQSNTKQSLSSNRGPVPEWTCITYIFIIYGDIFCVFASVAIRTS